MTINTMMSAMTRTAAVITLGVMLMGAGSASPVLAKDKGGDKQKMSQKSKKSPKGGNSKVGKFLRIAGIINGIIDNRRPNRENQGNVQAPVQRPDKGVKEPGQPANNQGNGNEKSIIEQTGVLEQKKG